MNAGVAIATTAFLIGNKIDLPHGSHLLVHNSLFDIQYSRASFTNLLISSARL